MAVMAAPSGDPHGAFDISDFIATSNAASDPSTSSGMETPSRYLNALHSGFGWSPLGNTGSASTTPQLFATTAKGSSLKRPHEHNPFDIEFDEVHKATSAVDADATAKRPKVTSTTSTDASTTDSQSQHDDQSDAESPASSIVPMVDSPPASVKPEPQRTLTRPMQPTSWYTQAIPVAISQPLPAPTIQHHHARSASHPAAIHNGTMIPPQAIFRPESTQGTTHLANLSNLLHAHAAQSSSASSTLLPTQTVQQQAPAPITVSHKRKAASIAHPPARNPIVVEEPETEPSASVGGTDGKGSKRKHFLERNRQAACKSRQKRKAWIQELEARSQSLADSNAQLHVMIAALRDEVKRLRHLCASGCDCEAMREMLASSGGDVDVAGPFEMLAGGDAGPFAGHNGSIAATSASGGSVVGDDMDIPVVLDAE